MAWQAFRLWSEVAAGRPAGQDRLPAIYIGTPGDRRKAVCFMFGEQGISSIIKVPLAVDAGAGIFAEASILRALAEGLPDIEAPRLVSMDTTRQTSEQTWLDGTPTGREFGPLHARFLKALRTPGPIDMGNAVDEALRAAKGQSDALAVAAKAILERARLAGHVPAHVVHGDFAAWNLKTTGNDLAVCDWEEGALSGLPLQDLAHFFVNDAYLFGRRGSPFARLEASPHAREVMTAVGLDTTWRNALFLFYCGSTALVRLRRGDEGYARYLIDQSATLTAGQ
jgi:hypothetical protein